jgi:hypothetical protein
MLYAAELGLDPRRFEDDLANDNHTWRIEEDRLGGERAGVGGTPALFVNGVRYAGHMYLDGLLTAVEDASGSTGSSLGGGGVLERTGPLAGLLEEICSERRGVNNRTPRRVVTLAVEIAREGREGRKIGALFVVGDSEAVLERSRPMILDPLYGHPHESKRIEDPDLRERRSRSSPSSTTSTRPPSTRSCTWGSAAATWPPPPYRAERRPWRWRSLRARR